MNEQLGVWLLRKEESGVQLGMSVWAFADRKEAREAFDDLCKEVANVYGGAREMGVGYEPKYVFYSGRDFCRVELYFCRYGRNF